MRPQFVLTGVLLAAVLLAMQGLSCNRSDSAGSAKQEAEPADRPVEARPGSKAKLNSALYDFGIMETGQTGKHTFKITSVGDEPLAIKQGKSTCKCTVGGLSAGGKTIAKGDTLELKKGESASIELTWTATAMSEMFHQSATLYTSDPDQPRIELTIDGQVRELIMLEPHGDWNVGSIDGNQPGEFTGTIGSAILDKFKITSITCADKTITAKEVPVPKEELKRSRFKSGYRIKVSIKPTDTIGKFNEKLVIKTDARDGLTFSPSIMGVRTGPALIRAAQGVLFNGDTMRLSLGRFPTAKGSSAELRLYVGGLGDSELKITKVENDADQLQVALHKVDDPEAKPGKNGTSAGRRKIYRLVFTVPPGKAPASRTGSQAVKVTLHTNHKRMQTMALAVSFSAY